MVIVTYNSAAHVGRLLESLGPAAAGLTLRTVVVDNGSVDGTVELVRDMPGVMCFETGANLGYAGAINVGRALLEPYDSLLILNPDLWFEDHAVNRLVDALAHPGTGIAVPMLLDEGGNRLPSLRREPTIAAMIGDALFGRRLPGRPAWLSETVWSEKEYGHGHVVDWATGAAMLLSKACDAAVGGWDERRFFLYSEETDACARARDAGFRVEYVPGARARHTGAGSGESEALVALMAVNRIRYYEKRHGPVASTAFRAAVAFSQLLRSGVRARRIALRTVLRRRSWPTLPGGRDA